MVNDIKLDVLVSAQSATKNVRKELAAPNASINRDDVTITNSIGALVGSLIAENSVPDNQQRIIELKQKIENNEYKVDIDRLAAKLSHTIVNLK